jgi:hypothetical protein
MVLGESRKKVKKVKIGFTEETLKEAKALADRLTEGNLSRLIRELVHEKYKEIFGSSQQGGSYAGVY